MCAFIERPPMYFMNPRELYYLLDPPVHVVCFFLTKCINVNTVSDHATTKVVV